MSVRTAQPDVLSKIQNILRFFILAFQSERFIEASKKFPVDGSPESISRRRSFDLITFFQSSIVPVMLCFFPVGFVGIYYGGLYKIFPIILLYWSNEVLCMWICGYALDRIENNKFDTKFWEKTALWMRISAVIQNDFCLTLVVMAMAPQYWVLIAFVWITVTMVLSPMFYSSARLAVLALGSQVTVFYLVLGRHLSDLIGFQGPDFWMEALPSVVMFGTGFIIASNYRRIYDTSISDLTLLTRERMLVEEKSEDLLRERNLSDATTDKISQAILLVNKDGIVMRANGSAMHLFSLDSTMLEAISIGDFLHIDVHTLNFSQQVHDIGDGQYIVQAFSLGEEYAPFSKIVVLFDVTTQIAEQNKVAQMQKMVAVGALSSGIAHDFNNVLSVIQTNVEILEKEYPDHHSRSLLSEIRSLTTSGGALTRQLLSYGRSVSSDKSTDNGRAILENVKSYTQRLIGANYTMSVDVQDDVKIETDIQLFETALLNLIINARDAMPKGGAITLRLLKVGRRAKFSVVDNGVGIAPEDIEAVTQPFISKKSDRGNVGLGLAMVSEFTNAMDGELQIVSTLGEGTEVSIYLNLEQDWEDAIVVPKVEKEIEKVDGAKILVVDDNVPLAKGLSMLLSRHGYQVDWCTSSQELEEIKDCSIYDVIICDLLLVGETGEDIYHWFDEQGYDPIFIFVSGNFSPELQDRLLALDEVSLLDKPVTSEKLLKAITSRLKARKKLALLRKEIA